MNWSALVWVSNNAFQSYSKNLMNPRNIYFIFWKFIYFYRTFYDFH